MAVNKEEELWYEDDGCMNCGDMDFHESKVPGLCLECYGDPTSQSWEQDELAVKYEEGAVS